jgi:predicted DCC family thiol-disulfide oxidoreductase YuxK
MDLLQADDMKIVLFDGICNFCNASVNMIMVRDKKNVFKFAAMQSPAGIEQQKKFGFNPNDLKTFILIDDGKVYTKTTAALRVAKHLGFPYSMAYIFIIIPPFIRNIVYNIIAKYRYRWFGKTEACRIPTPEERAKFL